MSAGLFTMPTVGRTMKGLTATQVIILEAAAKSPTGSVRFGPGDRKGTRIVSRDEMGTPCIVAYCTPEHFLVGRGLLAPANSCERAKDDVPPGLFGARNRQKKMTPYPQKTSPVRNRRQLTSLVSEVASRWTDEQLAPRPLSAVRGSISVPPRGPLVPFESSIERDFLMFCRTSHRVTAVHAQRLVIDFQDVKRGAARRYTPDFVVEVAADAGLSWRRAVVEVKTHRDLWRSRRLMRAPYAAARTWAAGQEGTIFRVVTDRMMSGEWLSSTRLLSGHLDKPFDVQFEQDCVAFLQQRDSYRISEILALAQQRGLNPQALLPVLYRMVARGQLSLDRGQPIGPQTWVAVVGSQKRL